MPAALSPVLRKRVIAAIKAGSSCWQAAERFGVGEATAIRWYARFRHEGDVTARPMGGDRKPKRVNRVKLTAELLQRNRFTPQPADLAQTLRPD